MGKKRILIIDDEVDFAKIVKMNLEFLDKSFEVVLASDGKEGIKKAKAFQPHLILLDVMMPKTDGVQVLNTLKEDARTAMIPVIMLTARNDEETKLKTAENYSEDFITKPIEAAELKFKVDTVLRRAGIV